MFAWLKEILDIRYENRKRNAELKLEVKDQELRMEPEYTPEVTCESCETLRKQLEIANDEKRRLLDRLLEKPEPEKVEVDNSPRIIPPAGAKRWSIERRELEANDRRVAHLIQEKKKELEIRNEDITEFEKEVEEAAEKREAAK